MDTKKGCFLTAPKTEAENIICDLFSAVGEKTDTDYRCYNAYNLYQSLGFYYDPEFRKTEPGVSYLVPSWAIDIASRINQIVRDAEDIGREKGYNNGLSDGKSFVRQLAQGIIAPNDFNEADGRDDRRLNRKNW